MVFACGTDRYIYVPNRIALCCRFVQMWSHPGKPENEVICMLGFAILWMCLFLISAVMK